MESSTMHRKLTRHLVDFDKQSCTLLKLLLDSVCVMQRYTEVSAVNGYCAYRSNMFIIVALFAIIDMRLMRSLT